MKRLKNIDINKVAAIIESEAGQKLPELRESLAQAKEHSFSTIHTPEQIKSRKRGRPVGSKQTVVKEAIKIRLDADVLDALRSTGNGWQTRINDTLRSSLALAGKLNK